MILEPWEKSEPVLASLQIQDTTAKRAERIRARCLAALEAQRQHDLKHRPILNAWRRWLEPALALALSALYLAAAIKSSLSFLLSQFQ